MKMKEKILMKLDELVEVDVKNCNYWKKQCREAEKSGNAEQAKKCLEIAQEAKIEALTISSVQKVIEALYEKEEENRC